MCMLIDSILYSNSEDLIGICLLLFLVFRLAFPFPSFVKSGARLGAFVACRISPTVPQLRRRPTRRSGVFDI